MVCRLPGLSELWIVIQGHTLLPTLTLPNLKMIDVEYENHLDWLEGFRGATLEKLERVHFCCESEQIGDFLGAFESAARTTSIRNTLSLFAFRTSRPWNPTYSSLLSFARLKHLEIDFSCDDGCSSAADDGVITTLAQGMPMLEVLRLGDDPCRTSTGATVNGLISLARRCTPLAELRLHFQASSLANVVKNAAGTSPDELIIRREECALKNLEVGRIPIPAGSSLGIALVLLQIFPRILDVRYINPAWEGVTKTIKDFRRVGTFVYHAGEIHPPIYITTLVDLRTRNPKLV